MNRTTTNLKMKQENDANLEMNQGELQTSGLTKENYLSEKNQG